MQEFIIVLIFAAALGFLGYRTYRSFARKQAGCGKGCGCATDVAARPAVSEKKNTYPVA